MKLWMPVLILAAVAGCQAQQKPPAPATSPSVLDVTAPPANYQPTAYRVSATPITMSGPAYVPPADGPAYVPPRENAPAITHTRTTPGKVNPARESTYLVRHGDTLYRIAREHYGDGKKWQQIVQANPGLTPASLKAGQKIVMP